MKNKILAKNIIREKISQGISIHDVEKLAPVCQHIAKVCEVSLLEATNFVRSEYTAARNPDTGGFVGYCLDAISQNIDYLASAAPELSQESRDEISDRMYYLAGKVKVMGIPESKE